MLKHVTASTKRYNKAKAARKTGSKQNLPPRPCSREAACSNSCCEQGARIWERSQLAPRVCLLGTLELHHGRWFTPATEHSCGGPYFVKRGSIKHTLAATAAATAKVEQAKGAHDLDATITDIQRNRDERNRLMAQINALDSQHKALATGTLPLCASSPRAHTNTPSPPRDKVVAWRRPLAPFQQAALMAKTMGTAQTVPAGVEGH